MRPRPAVLASVLLVAAGPGLAKVPGIDADNPVVSSRWNVQIGGFAVDLDTSAAATFEGRLGSFASLENLLGLENNQSTARLDGFYRIRPRHALDFSLLSIRREATTALSENFTFADIEFEAMATVESSFDMDAFQIIYKYSFINNGTVNAGASLGLSTFRLSGDVAGTAVLRDSLGNEIGASFARTGTEFFAPVPSYGMFVDYAVRRWLIVRLSAGALDLNVGDIDGRFLDTRATLDFYFTRHVGIGVGFNNTSLEYQDTGDDPFRIDYRYGGVLLYVGVSF